MVKCGLVSVGVLVEPEPSPTSETGKASPKSLTVGLQYRAEMSDFIIKVSDHDSEFVNNGDSSDPTLNTSGNKTNGKSNGGGTGSAVEKVGTLQRIDCTSFSGRNRLNSRSTTRNRPSCRKSRSESQLVFDNGSCRAYVSGLKTNNLTSANNNKSCDFYRQKFLQEGFLNQSSEYSDWVDFSTIQKTAGQKVVNKLAAQQKKLEEEAQKQRKKSLMGSGGSGTGSGSGSGSDNENKISIKVSQNAFAPLKKKINRLEPITLYAIKHSD